MKPSLRPSIAAARPAGAANERVLTRRSARRLLRHVASAPAALVESLWNDPDVVMSAATDIDGDARLRVTPVKAGDRTTIVRLDDPAAPDHALVLKRYNRMDQLHTIAHLPLRSRAAWSWRNARTLIAAGLPTPIPLAYVEERIAGIFRLRSWLLTQFVPGRSLRDIAASLGDYSEPNPPMSEVRAPKLGATDQRNPLTSDLRPLTSIAALHDLARQFAAIWQRLGQLRIGHGDMKATNFIVQDTATAGSAGEAEGQAGREAGSGPKLWLIDLDGMRTYRTSIMLRRERRNDLARFMRNWQGRPEVEAIFRARIGTG